MDHEHQHGGNVWTADHADAGSGLLALQEAVLRQIAERDLLWWRMAQPGDPPPARPAGLCGPTTCGMGSTSC